MAPQIQQFQVVFIMATEGRRERYNRDFFFFFFFLLLRHHRRQDEKVRVLVSRHRVVIVFVSQDHKARLPEQLEDLAGPRVRSRDAMLFQKPAQQAVGQFVLVQDVVGDPLQQALGRLQRAAHVQGDHRC